MHSFALVLAPFFLFLYVEARVSDVIAEKIQRGGGIRRGVHWFIGGVWRDENCE